MEVDEKMAGEFYYTIGLDVGSSGLKAILKRNDGKVMEVATRKYYGEPDENGQSEQNPEIWWKATVETVRELMEKTGVSKERVKGVGFSGQMHGLVPIDEDMNVIRPSIIWNDETNKNELDFLLAKAEEVIQETGSSPYMRGTGVRVLGMYNEERSAYNTIDKILLPKDYVAMKMTGKPMSEISGFSATLLMNTRTGRLSKKMMELCQVKDSMIPQLIRPEQSRGHLTEQAAQQLGLTTDCVVAGGLPDQPAGHLGNGYMAVNAQTGTSLVTFVKRPTGRKIVAGEGIVYVLDAFGKGGYILCSKSGGGVLDWYAKQRPDLADEAEQMGGTIYDIMDKRAAEIAAGADGLIFLPYLSGEISPHMDPDAKGAWIGITQKHTSDHFLRAVYDSLAGYIWMDFNDMLKNKFKIKPDKVSSAGGLMNSPLMRKIIASSTGWEVNIPESGQHAGAYAGAMCADVAAGLVKDLETAVSQIKIPTVVGADANLGKLYKVGHPLYRQAYQQLAPLFASMAQQPKKK